MKPSQRGRLTNIGNTVSCEVKKNTRGLKSSGAVIVAGGRLELSTPWV